MSDRAAQNGVLIVGAGLAGLTLALALARAGIKTTVIEKQRRITPSRWAILLYPVGMKIFHDLGVLEDIESLAMPLKNPQVDTAGGKVLSVIETGSLVNGLDFGLALGPSEIREVLRRHAVSSGVELMEGVAYEGLLRNQAGGVTGVRASEDGKGFDILCDLLVGADGYKSRVRDHFSIDVESRTYPPAVAMFLKFEHGLDRFHMVLAGGYTIVLLPLAPQLLEIGFYSTTISREELVAEGEESVKGRISAAVPALADALKSSIAKFADDSMLIIEPREIWARAYTVNGGVLIGDAAHSFHPGTGQGAQQAFLDAMMLAPVVKKCLAERTFDRKGLMEFEKPRLAFMRFWKGNSRRLISMQTAQGRFGVWLRDRYMRKAGELSKKRENQEILYGYRAPSRMELLRLGLALFL